MRESQGVGPPNVGAESERTDTLRLELPPGVDAERLLDAAADSWGAERTGPVSGGTIRLPVLAGIRRGRKILRTRLVSSTLEFEVEKESWQIHRSAVTILAGGAMGALTLVLWPFFPAMLALAPIGFFLALGAWLLVAARLSNAGAEEFLELVEQLAHEDVTATRSGPME